MTYEFFPGANSPTGFFSRFDPILADPALRRKLYIKGGPGCGKSTLMRRLAQLAADHGADTVQGLCASDPDSLDLLLIPQAGFAICDATAPHVCEPPLCGCDGVYCDLGRFYTPGIIEHSFELKQLKQAHSACYVPARHALTAVQAIDDLIGEENAMSGTAVSKAMATINTDKEILRDALEEHNLISGEQGAYGLYVKVVNGIKADYDEDGGYCIKASQSFAVATAK